MSTINEDHMMSGSHDFCHFGPFLDPPNNSNKQNFEKMKRKTPGYTIIFCLSTTNDIMMYSS